LRSEFFKVGASVFDRPQINQECQLILECLRLDKTAWKKGSLH
jgi:hypothetical protein